MEPLVKKLLHMALGLVPPTTYPYTYTRIQDTYTRSVLMMDTHSHTRTHSRTHTHIHTYSHSYTQMRMAILYICTNHILYMHTHNTYAQTTYICTHTHTYTLCVGDGYTHTHSHTLTHTHKHTYTHTHTRRCTWPSSWCF